MASSTGFEPVWGKHQDRSADVEERKTAETTAKIHKSRQGFHMLQLWETRDCRSQSRDLSKDNLLQRADQWVERKN